MLNANTTTELGNQRVIETIAIGGNLANTATTIAGYDSIVGISETGYSVVDNIATTSINGSNQAIDSVVDLSEAALLIQAGVATEAINNEEPIIVDVEIVPIL